MSSRLGLLFNDTSVQNTPIPNPYGGGLIGEWSKTSEDFAKFFRLVMHPSIIWDWIVVNSYYLALIIMTTVFIYFVISKSEKALRIIMLTFMAYVMIILVR